MADEQPDRNLVPPVEDVPPADRHLNDHEAEEEPPAGKHPRPGMELDPGPDINEMRELVKKVPRRRKAQMPPEIVADMEMIQKYAKRLEKLNEAEEAKTERLTKKQREMYIPSWVNVRARDDVDPFSDRLRPIEYEASRFAPGPDMVDLEYDDNRELCMSYPLITAKLLDVSDPTMLDPSNEHLNERCTQTMLSMLRERVCKLAGRLSSGQVYAPWIYEFVLMQSIKSHTYHLRVPMIVALEYELCGTIPFIPLPREFEIYMNELTANDMYLEDIELIQFSRYKRTAVIPPRVLQCMIMYGTLTGLQLFLNYLAGKQMITPETDRIIQICQQEQGMAILLSNRFGNELFASRNFNIKLGTFLTPSVFFNKPHVMSRRCDIENRDQLYTLLSTIIQLDMTGEALSGRIMARDLIDPNVLDTDECAFSNAGRITQRLAQFKTPIVKASYVPLPGKYFRHLWKTHAQCNVRLSELYDLVLLSIAADSTCPLSSPMFRFVNRGTGNILTAVIPNAQLHDTIHDLTEHLHPKRILRHYGLMGTFVFRWEAKGYPRGELNKDMVKEAEIPAGSQTAEDVFLEMYAPSNVTIVMWVTDIPIPDYVEDDICALVRDSFKQRYEIFDLVDIDHGGSIMNIFTRSNAQQLSKVYQCYQVIEHDHLDKFMDYMDAFTQGATDTSIINKISVKVKQGLELGLNPHALLSYTERVYGTGNRMLIINSIAAQTPYRPVVKSQKPEFPRDVLTPSESEIARMTDNQLWILNFVEKLKGVRGFDKGRDHRNLLICGPPRAYKTSFAYFLDRFFHVYWKGVGSKGTHEFWRYIPKETELIIVDEWTPQESDWTWLNKVGEGSEHSVDQKYKEDNVIPAGTRILLLTNRHPSEIKAACISTTRGKDNAADELWNAFTRRFAIAHLSGVAIPYPRSTQPDRMDVVQANMSSDYFEHHRPDTDDMFNGDMSDIKELKRIRDMPDLASRSANLLAYVTTKMEASVGQGVFLTYQTNMCILSNDPTHEAVQAVLVECADLTNSGLS